MDCRVKIVPGVLSADSCARFLALHRDKLRASNSFAFRVADRVRLRLAGELPRGTGLASEWMLIRCAVGDTWPPARSGDAGTVLLFLNDDYEGGATRVLCTSFVPAAGTALITDQPPRYSAVKRGAKYVLCGAVHKQANT